MKRFVLIFPAIAGILLTRTISPLASQSPQPQALTLPLECSQGDCPLLHGVPQTAGMRSGFVGLKPGETVGWHTTAGNGEALVVLRGSGEARIGGQSPLPFLRPHSCTFRPPHGITLPTLETRFWNTCMWLRPRKRRSAQFEGTFRP